VTPRIDVERFVYHTLNIQVSMKQKQSLTGLNVLVTRPGDRGLKLASVIKQKGGNPVVLPLIKITPIVDESTISTTRHCVENLSSYDLLIFISVNAAHYGTQWIHKFWPKLPGELQIVAVGPATADALKPLASVIHYSASGAQSEDILELPVLKDVEGRRVALFRGKGGRELLAQTLRNRGAQVDYVETYERSSPVYASGQVLKTIDENQVNAITITSGQVLDSLSELVDIKTSGINQIPILVPSARIDQLATEVGFRTVINCSGADDQALLNALEQVALKRLGQS
jgi:uroporphyrinogen-III synthase